MLFDDERERVAVVGLVAWTKRRSLRAPVSKQRHNEAILYILDARSKYALLERTAAELVQRFTILMLPINYITPSEALHCAVLRLNSDIVRV